MKRPEKITGRYFITIYDESGLHWIHYPMWCDIGLDVMEITIIIKTPRMAINPIFKLCAAEIIPSRQTGYSLTRINKRLDRIILNIME
ncbi:hypothetical protein XY32_002776 [Salmonella enterica subsp. enterica]|nr:hypothetical protein [Salmonella enterica subsp. enterica serovar Javiana]